ncbi:hypothetical protein B296_00009488 [Ensete ventricosum]|uniref:Uncharacterized protein n=1 Tax=Ensete ventricosum TaxID=4639 RepID=A0A427AH78_ENSVE|nr:hypothetical protein B296_00009488 [Ensete ventricosum]
MTLSLLPPQREGRAHVRGAWLGSTGRPRCTARGPPSSAKMIEEKLLCLPTRCGLPLCLLSKHCWFRPVCASSPAVVSTQSWSSGRGKRAPGAFIVMVMGHPYLRSLLHMLLTMPLYFVAASVVLAVGRMTADPPMLMAGRAQSRRWFNCPGAQEHDSQVNIHRSK